MENWKDIKGYEGLYQVSDLGRIRNKNKVLKPKKSGNYLQITLSKNSRLKTYTIHSLVAIAFLNHKRCGFDLVVDHIDNDKLNNKAANLQILTTRQNLTKNVRGVSKYVGVTKHGNKWRSRITINGKRLDLGLYNCETAAHIEYQRELDKLK